MITLFDANGKAVRYTLDTRGMTFGEIRRRVRRICKEYGLHLLRRVKG